MFPKFNLIAGIFALSVFGMAQQQGWSMFDNVANSKSGGGTGSSRVYHK